MIANMATEKVKESLLRNAVDMPIGTFKRFLKTVVSNLDGRYGNTYLFLRGSNGIARYYVYDYSLGITKSVAFTVSVDADDLKRSLVATLKTLNVGKAMIVTMSGVPKAIVKRIGKKPL